MDTPPLTAPTPRLKSTRPVWLASLAVSVIIIAFVMLGSYFASQQEQAEPTTPTTSIGRHIP